MLEVVESEPRQPILVRDHQRGYLAALDRVHDRHERSASQVHPATDLGEPLVHPQTTRETEPLHRLDLCREIVLPPSRRHPAIHDRPAGTFVEPWSKNFPDVRLVEVPLPAGSAAGLDTAFPFPPSIWWCWRRPGWSPPSGAAGRSCTTSTRSRSMRSTSDGSR